MNDIYKLNILLKEMNWMAKEVDHLLIDLSRDEERGVVFEIWHSLFDAKLIDHIKEYVQAVIEEMEGE